MQRTMMAAVQVTDCTSITDANFYPSSIVLHQTRTVRIVKHLSPHTGCI